MMEPTFDWSLFASIFSVLLIVLVLTLGLLVLLVSDGLAARRGEPPAAQPHHAHD